MGKRFRVQMLGGFMVEYGGLVVIPKESRDSKVLQLFQYLLCNRRRFVPHQELLHALIEIEEQQNPLGTLKNLVYRLRKLLDQAGVKEVCILSRRGGYAISPSCSIWMDVEEFSGRLQKLFEHPKKYSEEMLEEALEIAELYQGDFLPKSAGEFWVTSLSVLYQQQYCDCVRIAYEAARELGKPASVLAEIERAARLYPYEPSLYEMHIRCLYQLGNIRRALEQYDAVSTRLMNDLAVAPSEQMRQLYREITGGLNDFVASPEEVREHLEEKERRKGAYFCNLQEFSSIFRFLVRYLERSGQSAFMVLCTLAERDGSPPENGLRASKMAEALHEAVGCSTRRGDVYTRYSTAQFLLLLMDLKQEDCDIVAERLRRYFYKQPKMKGTRLTVKNISIANLDDFLESDEKKYWHA